jgi:hypothetical protein
LIGNTLPLQEVRDPMKKQFHTPQGIIEKEVKTEHEQVVEALNKANTLEAVKDALKKYFNGEYEEVIVSTP